MPVTDHEFRVAQAALTHERAYRTSESVNQATMEYGANAIKAAGIINGGAAVALLALVGNILENATGLHVTGPAVTDCLILYIAGVAASAFASGTAYMTNYFYVATLQAHNWDFTHPYVHKTKASQVFQFVALSFHAFSLLLVIGSYLLFLLASFKACALLNF